MPLRPHPLSQELYAELLNRPSPAIETPSVIYQLTLMPNPEGIDPTTAMRQALAKLCRQFGAPAPEDQKHHHVQLGPVALRWEQHTEFSSLVLMAKDQLAIESVLPMEWLSATQHQLLTGSVISLLDNTSPQVVGSEMAGSVVGGLVLGGGAEIATTLRPNADGLVPYQIRNLTLDPSASGRLVQRLYEIETYRMMALMGLPLAKATSQTLNLLESQLVDLVERLGQTDDLSQDQVLLDELFGLAQKSEQLMADTDYRFSATQAYGRIVQDRLTEIAEAMIDQRQGLREFLERRFEPALRTTEHVTRRQESLSQRIARTVSLARTRVEVTLQTQHRTQLEAMARRAKLQLRLQRTVEGLSVMAISYYTIGILAYLLGGWVPTNNLKLLISLISPLLLLAIWWLLKRWRRQLLEEHDQEP